MVGFSNVWLVDIASDKGREESSSDNSDASMSSIAGRVICAISVIASYNRINPGRHSDETRWGQQGLGNSSNRPLSLSAAPHLARAKPAFSAFSQLAKCSSIGVGRRGHHHESVKSRRHCARFVAACVLQRNIISLQVRPCRSDGTENLDWPAFPSIAGDARCIVHDW